MIEKRDNRLSCIDSRRSYFPNLSSCFNARENFVRQPTVFQRMGSVPVLQILALLSYNDINISLNYQHTLKIRIIEENLWIYSRLFNVHTTQTYIYYSAHNIYLLCSYVIEICFFNAMRRSEIIHRGI